MTTLWAILAIAQRDVTKLVRDRARLAVNLAFPIVLIAGLGTVLQSTVGKVTGLDAVTLAFTGVLAASLFQSAAAGMISIVEDRETDFSRELFVAPVSRFALMAGKIAGESGVALLQGCFVVAAAGLVGVALTPSLLLRLALPCVATTLLGAAFGLATVALLPNQRSAMQVFQFLIIPQYVVAGVIVPLHGLPPYLDFLAWAMPLRYAVGLTREQFYAGSSRYAEVVVAGPVIDAVVVGGLFAVLLLAGTIAFTYRESHR
ncbi:ABC transporter permease [Fodinicola acaciae]|uniref:ABC transporter permease n=1 Tax=Fodinicola acaciae TaxID=2681555 RepID=UPI0013D8769B|nr:ABC transporter permease [Fodinicola acaciae]